MYTEKDGGGEVAPECRPHLRAPVGSSVVGDHPGHGADLLEASAPTSPPRSAAWTRVRGHSLEPQNRDGSAALLHKAAAALK